MSKELDKVKKISDMVLYNADGYATLPNEEVNLLIAIANQALQRLEAIDNANPSEALECLENLFSNVVSTTYNRESSLKDFNTIKQALLKAQEPKQYVDELKLVEKKLKALEIIKEKRIDIESFYSSFIERDFNYYFYSSWYRGYGRKQLTEEEFNLLKEILGC